MGKYQDFVGIIQMEKNTINTKKRELVMTFKALVGV
jgi:hypothetical protein